MVTVYRKSAKGQLEIETRVNRLHPRLRTVLILVDGRRNDDELHSLIQLDADATLLGLLEGGYIEVATAAPAAVDPAAALLSAAAQASAPQAVNPSSPSAPAAAAQAATRAAPLVAAPTGLSAAGLAERRRLAVRHLTDRLGPVAEPVSLRIEKARNWDEQQAALELGRRLLQTARGGAAAAEFASLFQRAPSG